MGNRGCFCSKKYSEKGRVTEWSIRGINMSFFGMIPSKMDKPIAPCMLVNFFKSSLKWL